MYMDIPKESAVFRGMTFKPEPACSIKNNKLLEKENKRTSCLWGTITYEEPNKWQAKASWYSLPIKILLYSTMPVRVQYFLWWLTLVLPGIKRNGSLIAFIFGNWYPVFWLMNGRKEQFYIYFFLSVFFLASLRILRWLILVFHYKKYLPLFSWSIVQMSQVWLHKHFVET